MCVVAFPCAGTAIAPSLSPGPLMGEAGAQPTCTTSTASPLFGDAAQWTMCGAAAPVVFGATPGGPPAGGPVFGGAGFGAAGGGMVFGAGQGQPDVQQQQQQGGQEMEM